MRINSSYSQGYIGLFPLLFLASILPIIFLFNQQNLSFYRTILGQRYQYLKQQRVFYLALDKYLDKTDKICEKSNSKIIELKSGVEVRNYLRVELVYQNKYSGYSLYCSKKIASINAGKRIEVKQGYQKWRLVKRSISDF